RLRWGVDPLEATQDRHAGRETRWQPPQGRAGRHAQDLPADPNQSPWPPLANEYLWPRLARGLRQGRHHRADLPRSQGHGGNQAVNHPLHGARDRGYHRDSLADVGKILDAHYLHRDPALAMSAIRELEANIAGTKITNRLQTGPKT